MTGASESVVTAARLFELGGDSGHETIQDVGAAGSLDGPQTVTASGAASDGSEVVAGSLESGVQ